MIVLVTNRCYVRKSHGTAVLPLPLHPNPGPKDQWLQSCTEVELSFRFWTEVRAPDPTVIYENVMQRDHLFKHEI